MNKPQAKAILALLSAAFPREPMPASTVEMWSVELERYEYDVADEAVRDLAMTFVRMPSFSELLDAIVETRVARMKRHQPPPAWALPSGVEAITFTRWLETEATPEQREQAIRLFPSTAIRAALDGAA